MSEKHQKQAREILSDYAGSPHPLQDIIAAALEAVERETAQRCAEIAGPSPWCEGMGGCCHDGCQERRKIALEIRTEFDKARAGKGGADAAE